jgi:hypothetical protein
MILNSIDYALDIVEEVHDDTDADDDDDDFLYLSVETFNNASKQSRPPNQ